MTWLEATGAILVIVNIALIVRRSLWNFPFGIAASAIYFVVMGRVGLYSGALLQLLFIAVQLYGWWNWRRFIGGGNELPVATMGGAQRWRWFAAAAVAALAWGTVMDLATDAHLPYPDAALSSASIVCQALIALRRVEGWVVWIGVNLGAIALFVSQTLFVTAALYVILLALSVLGLRAWWTAARTRTQPAEPALTR